MTSADPTVRPLESLSPQQLLDVVVRARAVGSGPEWERAVAAWKQLVAREHPRVLQSVKAFRFPHQPTVRIPPDEYDDVAIKCWERAVKMLGNFRGVSLGEFYAALHTCVQNTCKDHCRSRLVHEKKLAGSLDEPAPGADAYDPRGRFDAEVAELSYWQEPARIDARAGLDELAAAMERLDERSQAVVRGRIRGESSREIGQKLGESVANVDQIFRRAMIQIKGMMG